MIWDGFDGNRNGLYVMKQGGFCVEGRGESGLIRDLCRFLVMIQQTN
jgi:hypothetical protein